MHSTTDGIKPLVLSELNPPLNVHYISDATGLEKVRDFFKRVSVFTIDTETNVTKTFIPRRLRTIQVGDRNEQYVIDLLPFAQRAEVTLTDSMGHYTAHNCYKPIIDTLVPVLESKDWLKVGHNLQFDYEVLKWCLGIEMWNLYDTMWAEKVLYAGLVSFDIKGFWALDDLVARYAGLLIDKSSQTSFDLESPLTQTQIDYCALDCRFPVAIKGAQRDKITKANLWKTCQIEFDAIPAFGDMKLNGITLDKLRWMAEVNKVKEDHFRNVIKLDHFFLPLVGKKGVPEFDLLALENIWRETTDKELRAEARKKFMECRKHLRKCQDNMDSYEGEAAINYGSNPQLLAALRKHGFNAKILPNTNDRNLKICSENPTYDMKTVKKKDPEYVNIGIIDTLRLYRETKKVLTTYGEGFIRDYVDPDTGLIHSSIIQLAAETGRTSSRNPNIQNIPRGSDWRSCFMARPGYKLITMDYNGCELRILAEYSREPAFVEAFLKGWDVHSVGAEIIFGDEWKNAAEPDCAYYTKDHQKCNCKLHKELRDKIKAINFGIAYGMEAKKLAEGVGCTEEEAQKLLDKYRKSFPVLIAYLEKSAEWATTKMESRTLAQRRRLFHKPTWADAVVVAKRRIAEKEKKSIFDANRLEGINPTPRQVSSAFKGMYSAIGREGKNTPIQGSNADMAKLACGCGFDKNGLPFMWHVLKKYKALLVGFVHDEFLVEVPEGPDEQPCFNAVGDSMQRGGAELVTVVQMTWEGHLGERWKK